MMRTSSKWNAFSRFDVGEPEPDFGDYVNGGEAQTASLLSRMSLDPQQR
jgi:hypothetical protein